MAFAAVRLQQRTCELKAASTASRAARLPLDISMWYSLSWKPASRWRASWAVRAPGDR